MEHPSEQEIREYFQGKLKDDRFRVVDKHIETCVDCQDVLMSVQQIPPDEI